MRRAAVGEPGRCRAWREGRQLTAGGRRAQRRGDRDGSGLLGI